VPKINSLADFANKRFRLAGKAYLETWDPFFAQTDSLRQAADTHGGHFVSFANYDYLGLASHPAVKAAAAEALELQGIGALASRLVGGERSIHKPFEAALSAFIGTEATLTLVSGYLTNVTVISHIMGSRDGLFLDELSHNSIVSGSKSAASETVLFHHNDLDHLDYLLRHKRSDFRNVLIVAESLYSMDGDITDLARLIELKERHKAWLLIDEAHSIGVLGADGRGICEYAGIDPNRIDLIVGTLSKTLASCGGFVTGQAAVIDWLRYTLPGFVYSVGLSPVITAAAQKATPTFRRWNKGRRPERARHAAAWTAHHASAPSRSAPAQPPSLRTSEHCIPPVLREREPGRHTPTDQQP